MTSNKKGENDLSPRAVTYSVIALCTCRKFTSMCVLVVHHLSSKLGVQRAAAASDNTTTMTKSKPIK